MRKQTRWTHFGEEIEAPTIPEPERAPSKKEEEDAALPFSAGRIRLLVVVFATFVLAAVTRLASWQLFGATTRSSRASAQSVDLSRGRIVDSHGLLMATDSFIWEIYANPRDYKDAKLKPDLAKVAEKIGVPEDTLTSALAQESSLAIIARNVTASQCEIARHDKDVPTWIWCDGKRKRVYPQGSLGAQIVGFADSDQNGLTGIEAAYDDWLRTAGSWRTNQLPGEPESIPEGAEDYLPSPGGRDLVLNLDAALQYLVEKYLAEGVVRYQAKAGTIIILDVRTGAVLALANWPTFDPNQPKDASKDAVLNASVSAAYEPGSVFKLFTYAGALDIKQITPETVLTDAGKLEISNKIIYNAENKTYGAITARQALANSVNTISAQICLGMGGEEFYRYVRQFGFGRPTEIDLGPENAGIVKRPGTEYWSLFDQAANSFGQGISVTPIQLASAVAAIANNGTLMQPQVVKGLVLDGQMYRLPPRLMGQAIKPETAHTLAQMMVYTVENYVAGPNLVPGYRVAGKTGTAEIPEQGGYTSKLPIASFAGFLPAADPQIVILVKLVEPQASPWAEQMALPLFGQVAREAVRVLKIAPDNRMP